MPFATYAHAVMLAELSVLLLVIYFRNCAWDRWYRYRHPMTKRHLTKLHHWTVGLFALFLVLLTVSVVGLGTTLYRLMGG